MALLTVAGVYWFVLTSVILYMVLRSLAQFIKYRVRIGKIKRIPGRVGHWLMGGVLDFPGPGEDGLNLMVAFSDIYPKLSYIFMGPTQVMVNVTHPETAKYILKTAEPKPISFGGYANVRLWLGDGLLLANSKRWARNRRLLTPAFHFDILKPYMLVNNKAADVLCEKISVSANNEQYFEVFNHISLCTLDVILKCAFSYDEDIQTQGENTYVRAVQEILQTMMYRLLRPWLYPNVVFYLTPTGRRFSKNCKVVHSVSSSVVRRRKEALNKSGGVDLNNRKYLDFLDILITAKDENNVGLTESEIRDEVDTFLFEGHDTTSSAISWTLYCLAKSPEWQGKCQQEVDEILKGRDSDHILWDDLSAMKTVTLCIKEALRLHTTVPIIQRETTKDMYIDGVYVPAGTIVGINLYIIMHHLHVWDEPMEFRPERFLAENAEKLHTYANIPFSAGPRNCIGQNFAMHEMKCVVARVLRRFDLEVDPKRRAKPEMMGVMKSEDGMYVKARARLTD